MSERAQKNQLHEPADSDVLNEQAAEATALEQEEQKARDRERVLALIQKLIILAGAVAALWLAWRAFGPQDCNVCGRDRPAETGNVARDMRLETGGQQHP